MCRIGGGDFKAGEIALIPVNIFFNTQPDMQCEESYYLYYDSDCFDAQKSIACSYGTRDANNAKVWSQNHAGVKNGRITYAID